MYLICCSQVAQTATEAVGLEQCPFLNISVCPATVTASVKQQPFQVVAFNPLAWKRPTAIRVPVALKLHSNVANAAWDVTGEPMCLLTWHCRISSSKKLKRFHQPISNILDLEFQLLAVPKVQGVRKYRPGNGCPV